MEEEEKKKGQDGGLEKKTGSTFMTTKQGASFNRCKICDFFGGGGGGGGGSEKTLALEQDAPQGSG